MDLAGSILVLGLILIGLLGFAWTLSSESIRIPPVVRYQSALIFFLVCAFMAVVRVLSSAVEVNGMILAGLASSFLAVVCVTFTAYLFFKGKLALGLKIDTDLDPATQVDSLVRSEKRNEELGQRNADLDNQISKMSLKMENIEKERDADRIKELIMIHYLVQNKDVEDVAQIVGLDAADVIQHAKNIRNTHNMSDPNNGSDSYETQS